MIENLKTVAFTDNGEIIATKIAQLYNGEYTRCSKSVSIGDWVRDRFYESDALIFVGATGIAVRAIAPYVKSKATDPAVVVIDDKGQYVIPILSGHIGGANNLAREIADSIGAKAIITTSTDINGVLGIDEWAVNNGLIIDETSAIKRVSSKLIAGKSIKIASIYKITKDNNKSIGNIEIHEFNSSIDINKIRSEYDVIIDYHRIISEKNSDGSSAPLHLIPRTLIVGIGCKRGTSKEAIVAAYIEFLRSNNIDPKAICGFASIDLKSNEQGLLDFAAEEGIDISFYTADELNSVEGEYTSSEFVHRITGTDNICERSAVFCGEKGSRIIVKKTRFDGITMAIAEKVPDPLIIKK